MSTYFPRLIQDLKSHLTKSFQTVDTWFEEDPALRSYRPSYGGWSIDQVLEHIGLTNHFLLILIEKGTKKALNLASQPGWQQEIAKVVLDLNKLSEIGLHQSFEWVRPEHMEPRGEKTPGEVRAQLGDQLRRCLDCLAQMPNGEGVLYTTTMTVNHLGKINVYEYVYFLSQHAQRHLTQMEKIRKDYQEARKKMQS